MEFPELSIKIRGNTIEDIIALIPKVTAEFMKGRKIGSFSTNCSNYEFWLSSYKERKEQGEG